MAASPYAEVEDVLARAGDVSRAWSEETRPSLDDIDRMIDAASFFVDAAFGSRGVAMPPTAEVVLEALRAPVAVMALQAALRATPGAGTERFRDEVNEEVDRFWAAIADGTWPGLLILSGGDTGIARDAASLWTDGADLDVVRAQTRTLLDPESAVVSTYNIRKGMLL